MEVLVKYTPKQIVFYSALTKDYYIVETKFNFDRDTIEKILEN